MEEDIKQELEQLKEKIRQLEENQRGSTHFKDLPEEDQMKIVRLYVDHLHKSDKTEVDLEGILTEAQKTDLTDSGASTAHKHDHGGMDGLDDDDHNAIYYNKTTIDALIAPVVATLTAGESIAGTPPYYPVFIKDADNKFYLSDANDTDRLQFDGFVKGNVSADATQSVQLVGIVDGFTGLDTGKLYYVQDSIGQIGTSPGSTNILVGKAVSATELLIMKKSPTVAPESTAGDYLIGSSDAEVTLSYGTSTYTKIKELTTKIGGTFRIKFSMHRHASETGTVYGRVYRNGAAVGTEQSTDSTSYVEFSEDIEGWSPGDLIQIYYKNPTDGDGNLQNFRIYTGWKYEVA
jgi:hypothetical protein